MHLLGSIPDSPENVPLIDHFGEHQQECIAEAPAEAFHAGINPCEGKEVMEQVPSDGEIMSSDSSEESDSDEGIPRCCHSDSISQAEEGEDREELAGEPAKGPAKGPTEELTEELTGEPAEGPTKGLTEEPTVGCPTSG